MLDENSPLPMDSSDASAPAPTSNAPDASLDFTPEQRESLGLTDCAPGETYTVQIRCTGNDPETGPTFEAAGPAEPDSADAGADDESDAGDLSPDEADDSGESPVGYSRKSKTPRVGLPDTKKLRDM